MRHGADRSTGLEEAVLGAVGHARAGAQAVRRAGRRRRQAAARLAQDPSLATPFRAVLMGPNLLPPEAYEPEPENVFKKNISADDVFRDFE